MIDQNFAGRRLRSEEIEQFHREGYLHLPGFFDLDEMSPLRSAYRDDPTIAGHLFGMRDSVGQAQPICIWNQLGDDIIGMIPRMERMVAAAEALLGEPCYHWHSKFAIKPGGCEAHFEWHQDFWGWYLNGVLAPKMLSVALGVEPCTVANGCMQVVRRSHLLGRIDHMDIGKGYGVDPVRLEKAEETLGVHDCVLAPGDGFFFHSNTLHGSGPNPSNTPRVMMHISYNAVSNEPLRAAGDPQNPDGGFMNITADERAYRPIDVVPDDVLRERRFKSAFHHTRFPPPNTDLDRGNTAVPI